jgi:type III secretion system FlhB-like substrate exporter
VLAVRASPLLEVQSLIIYKMVYKIHYAKLDLQGDIPCLEFTSIEEVRSFITSIVYPLKMVNEKVYVIAIQDEVIVTENGLLVEELFDGNLNSAYPFYEGEDIFIQEYPSYEEAYKVALDMKEVSPLCYTS